MFAAYDVYLVSISRGIHAGRPLTIFQKEVNFFGRWRANS